MKKTIALISFILSNVLFTYATPPRGDLIHWNDTVCRLLPFPLELWEEFELTSELLFGVEGEDGYRNCFRGFQAEWKVIENELFLMAIYSCNNLYSVDDGDSLKANLSHLFPGKLKKGLVKADWVTGDFWLSKGEIIFDNHDGIGLIYEQDVRLTFHKGMLTGTEAFNNQKKSVKSVYTEDSEVLDEFIYSNIRWEKIPELNDSTIKVFIGFEMRQPGKPQNVRIMRGAGEPYDKEAFRVISMIPDWTIHFTHGQYWAYSWNIPVIFNEEKRKKYAHPTLID